MKAHLLYVEDDADLSFVTRDNLELHDYQITCCDNGKSALDLIRTDAFDLCILDVMLPEIDGFTLATEIRKVNQQVPILFLTAKSLPEDRLHGLRIGGDDFLTKPFSMEELLLKIDIFLKRRHLANPLPSGAIPIGRYVLDYSNLLLHLPGDSERRLTQKEADLLRLLSEKRNQVVRRSAILEAIWGEDDYFLGRSLDVFISRLRKYLKEDPDIRIENVHGIGFQFMCPEQRK
ncbi:MAG: response regulator transcription factor [Haliscomenobacter sp.]|nr:response regulator transcription factor [Haliscomenobacter sp.]MBK8655139.1 response regulator transcription factor [Haliscomenobacter sp.]